MELPGLGRNSDIESFDYSGSAWKWSVPLVIVGIDESGDFRMLSRGYWVAIFIRPSELAEVSGAHLAWERMVRRDLEASGELKGASVTDSWAKRFVSEVMRSGTFGVRYAAFAVDVSHENLRGMAVQRSLLSDGYDGEAERRKLSDDRHVRKSSGSIRSIGEWCKAIEPVRMLRLTGMMHVVSQTLELAVAISALNGFDDELGELSVVVDSGYVRGSELAWFGELLRNSLWHWSHEHPIPMLNTWTPDHPFMRRWVQSVKGSAMVMRPSFKEVITFASSEQSIPIRIADVTVSLLRRASTGNLWASTSSALRRRSVGTDPFAVLDWSDVNDPGVRGNPWTST